MKSNKRILVAGGAGFLGSHLCESLLAQGHHVICVDNFYTGKKENLLKLRHHPSFKMMHHDVCLPLSIQVDEIYNLACPASPLHYQFDPVMTVKTNVSGAITLLDLAKQTNAKILQASTSEVYGDPLVHPQTEEYWGNVNPIGPRACYDEGKRCAETLFFAYHQQYQTKIKIARIFNTYGPRMDSQDGRVVSNFIVQALSGNPLTIYGEGQQTRSFCFVSDLIHGLIRLMESDDTVTGPINLGNPNEMTMLQLAEHVLTISGCRVPIIFEPYPQDDPKQRKPNIEKAKNILGWEPKVTLQDGLKETIAYFQGSLRNTFPVKHEVLV